MFRLVVLVCAVSIVSSFTPISMRRNSATRLSMQGDGLKIDMKGKVVFVAGVADSTGYGWAIAKACAEAGATILLGMCKPTN